jgi:hypothetical protein
MKKENPVEGASINADDQRVFKPNDWQVDWHWYNFFGLIIPTISLIKTKNRLWKTIQITSLH